MLIDLMNSIYEKAEFKNDIEFLIKIDDDDVTSDYHVLLADNFRGKVKYEVFVETRSHHICNDYYNYLANKANGEFIWPLNDDCILVGPDGWDHEVIHQVHGAGLSRKISYTYVGVVGHGETYSPFPIVSRETVQALGWLHDPKITTWKSDEILGNIFQGLRNIHGIDRVINLKDRVTIDHFNWCGSIGDETQEHMKEGFDKGLDAGGYKDGGHYDEPIEKLKYAIDSGY
jgi:hypothetical protein